VRHVAIWLALAVLAALAVRVVYVHDKTWEYRLFPSATPPKVGYLDRDYTRGNDLTRVEAGLVRSGQTMKVSVQAPAEVEGPIDRGARLGRAVVSVDGQRAASVPLLAGRAVSKASALDRARSFLGDNALWLVLALSAILLAAAFLRRLTR